MRLIKREKLAKRGNWDNISGFNISTQIVGLLVADTPEYKESSHWPQEQTEEWYQEYIEKHCIVSVSMTDAGDCIRVNSSDADVMGIRGFIVGCDIVYNESVLVSGVSDIREHAITDRMEIVIAHHNRFGSEGIDCVTGVIQGMGFNHIARKMRMDEINGNSASELGREISIDCGDPFEVVVVDKLDEAASKAEITYPKSKSFRVRLPTRISSVEIYLGCTTPGFDLDSFAADMDLCDGRNLSNETEFSQPDTTMCVLSFNVNGNNVDILVSYPSRNNTSSTAAHEVLVRELQDTIFKQLCTYARAREISASIVKTNSNGTTDSLSYDVNDNTVYGIMGKNSLKRKIGDIIAETMASRGV